MHVDVDAFIAAHQGTWVRLEALSKKRVRSADEADELVDLYQEVATHLSMVRSQAPDASVIAYLSELLSKARLRATGTRVTPWKLAVDFVTRRLPGALYLSRRWWLTTMLVSYALTFLVAWWLTANPQIEQTLISPRQIDQLVNHDFADYYKQAAASHFAAKVWTNNVWVSVLCLALGLFGIPVIYMLFQNMFNLAVIGSIMVRHDRGDLFFGLILPHGLLELTAVFVAAGYGLRVFWAWVVPSPMTRLQALARVGRGLGAVAIGLVGMLAVSGAIEGFVTPSDLPTWARITIGIAAELAFLVYVFVLGSRAVKTGETGDLDPSYLEGVVAAAD